MSWALVIGSTGHTGRETVRLLVRSGVSVRAVSRDIDAAMALPELAGADLFEGDSALPETLIPAFEGVEKLYYVPPTVEEWATLQSQLIEIARDEGVQHMARISTVGTAPDADSMTLRSHWQGEREMEQSGMAYTHIRSNSFYQNCLFDKDEIARNDLFYSCVGNVRYAKVDTRDLAGVIALSLTQPGHENQAYTLTGPEPLSYHDMASKLSAALGREIRYVDLPNPDYRDYLVSTGLPTWLADEFVAMYGNYEEGSFVTETTETVQGLLGRPPRSFDDFARDYRSFFASKPRTQTH